MKCLFGQCFEGAFFHVFVAKIKRNALDFIASKC